MWKAQKAAEKQERRVRRAQAREEAAGEEAISVEAAGAGGGKAICSACDL